MRDNGGVSDGGAKFEYEGMWGLPDRNWRFAKKWLPSLAKLDFLPSFLFSGLLLLATLLAVGWLVFGDMGAGDEAYEPKRPRDPKRLAKVD